MSSLLEIKNLSITFPGDLKVIQNLNLNLKKGQLLGLVGESGSGKSLTALSIMGLLPKIAKITEGEIFFKNKNILNLKAQERRKLLGQEMGMVFQEPLTALNPVLTIGTQLAEIFQEHRGVSKKEGLFQAEEILGKVGLPSPHMALKSYPHRFSGGMRQRVVIAMAVALKPNLIIADEPTTALDPTIASQILFLLKEFKEAAIIFITHNLKLLEGYSDKILVMYRGLILEEATSFNIFNQPKHPYTKGLLKALPPGLNEKVTSTSLKAIKGAPPKLSETFLACPFLERCEERQMVCETKIPELSLSGNSLVRCFLYE